MFMRTTRQRPRTNRGTRTTALKALP